MSKNKYTSSRNKSKYGIVTRSTLSGTISLRSREIMILDDNASLVNTKRKISSEGEQAFKKSKQDNEHVTQHLIDNPLNEIEHVREKNNFSCNAANDLRELSRLLNTDFKAGTNKNIDKMISIRPVPLLQNDAKQRSFGVFATKDITFASNGLNENRVLVEYIGKKKILSKEAKDRAYTMVLNEGDDVTDPTVISALELRNWSAMVNSASCAQLANIVIDQVEDNNGEAHIVYLLERPIKKGEQLLVYYGEEYSFDNKLFLNPNDSWQETREQWLEYQDYYHNALLFDASYALPNIDKILKDKNSEVVDIAALRYGQNNDFMPQHKQEHYTALHIACSQADLREINKLLVLGANPYRQSSISGHSPLHLVVSSTAPIKMKINIIQAVWEMEPAAIMLQDNKDNTILHLAVQRKELELIKYLLTLEIPNQDKNVPPTDLSDYVNSNNWDYVCCLLAQGDFTLLDNLQKECLESLEALPDFYEENIPKILAHLADTDKPLLEKVSVYLKKTYPRLWSVIGTHSSADILSSDKQISQPIEKALLVDVDLNNPTAINPVSVAIHSTMVQQPMVFRPEQDSKMVFSTEKKQKPASKIIGLQSNAPVSGIDSSLNKHGLFAANKKNPLKNNSLPPVVTPPFIPPLFAHGGIFYYHPSPIAPGATLPNILKQGLQIGLKMPEPWPHTFTALVYHNMEYLLLEDELLFAALKAYVFDSNEQGSSINTYIADCKNKGQDRYQPVKKDLVSSWEIIKDILRIDRLFKNSMGQEQGPQFRREVLLSSTAAMNQMEPIGFSLEAIRTYPGFLLFHALVADDIDFCFHNAELNAIMSDYFAFYSSLQSIAEKIIYQGQFAYINEAKKITTSQIMEQLSPYYNSNKNEDTMSHSGIVKK